MVRLLLSYITTSTKVFANLIERHMNPCFHLARDVWHPRTRVCHRSTRGSCPPGGKPFTATTTSESLPCGLIHASLPFGRSWAVWSVSCGKPVTGFDCWFGNGCRGVIDTTWTETWALIDMREEEPICDALTAHARHESALESYGKADS